MNMLDAIDHFYTNWHPHLAIMPMKIGDYTTKPFEWIECKFILDVDSCGCFELRKEYRRPEVSK